MKRITIGFSIHRPEIIPVAADLMRRHEAIFLEDPPDPEFRRMLRGDLTIDDYLLGVDVEYPVFSRRMCRLLRELHREGKKIFQVEPFLEHLLEIHSFLAEGHAPSEIPRDSLRYRVYLAERNATGALLDYYRVVLKESFDATLEAVIRFARFDADRFRLRDDLRSRALLNHLKNGQSVFVEAGSIHWSLGQMLRQRLHNRVPVRPVFIAHEVLNTLGEKGHLYGPGDQLTLAYIFHPNIETTARERLLAARALVYTKLIEKQEFAIDSETFPHVRNELACIRTVKLLNLNDCGRLFPTIRRLKTPDARHLVHDYLVGVKKLSEDSLPRFLGSGDSNLTE